MSRRDPVDRAIDLAFGIPIAMTAFAREATRFVVHSATEALGPSESPAESEPRPEPPAATMQPPLEGYDSMEARQLVALLDDTDRAVLDVIEAYERQGRARRTVLVKIETLRASAPT